jgi:xylulokinase
MSTGSLLLGLDIGTQGVKGVIVQTDGKVVARASLERGPVHPHPGWAEMDAEMDWWGSALQILRELVSAVGSEVNKLQAIGICALVPCLCPLDQTGRPLRPAILYSDNRALQELAWVNQQAGLTLNAEAVVPKLVWIQRNEPQVFEKTASVASCQGYVVYQLTDQLFMDYDCAAIMGSIFDPVKKSWREDIIERVGLPLGIWPELSPATGIAGKVTQQAAAQTGLPQGIPVIAGTGDTYPTIVGCGAVEVGDAMVSYGTTGLLTLANQPLVESSGGPHFSASDGGAAVTWGANVLSAGRLIRWYVEQFAGNEKIIADRLGQNVFHLLEQECSRIPAGSEGLIVLPHWLGRRTPSPNANLRGSILGLTPSHTSIHIYRAIMEAFAYNVRQSFNEFRPAIKRLVATAGGARSQVWRQVVSDVLNMTLSYHPESSGSLGIAFLAGYAVGLVTDFGDIKYKWLRNPQEIVPIPENVRIYDKLFPTYCEFDEALVGPYANLTSGRFDR